MAGLNLSGLTKRFDKTEVLHGVDAEIGDGEFLVVVGPSGCGKSTILRLIAGLEEVSAGQVRIDGRLVNDLEPKDRDVAMVFQNYALYPHMNVYKNMAYGLKTRGYKKADIDQRVRRAAGVLGLEELLERKPRQLSGGQRQRVAMGRCIVREPSVFLFDEPLSNLDAKLRTQMRVELKKLHRQLKTTSIYVTHDQVEAMTLADRIMVLNDGRIEQLDRPDEIYNRPRTAFVARFIGSPAMNLVPARINRERDQLSLADGPRLPLAVSVNGFEGGEVTMGLRPEDLSIADERNRSGPGLTVRVELHEPMGADTVVHCSLPKIDQPLIARLSGNQSFEEGVKLDLVFDPAKVHLFDSEKGRRIG